MVLENPQCLVDCGDDIIVFSDAEQEHNIILEAVLRRVVEADKKNRRKKLQTAQKLIACLGYIASNG